MKRHLDTWRRRQAEQASAVELPSELTEQGNALTRALWRVAQQWAEREVKLAREQPAADIPAAQREQAAALKLQTSSWEDRQNGEKLGAKRSKNRLHIA